VFQVIFSSELPKHDTECVGSTMLTQEASSGKLSEAGIWYQFHYNSLA